MPQPPPGRSTTLVIGQGTPILGDDGVGWRVAEAVRQALAREPDLSVDVECFALGGLSLMEHMVGYSRAIVIDAMMTGRPPGTITTFRLDGRAGESQDSIPQPKLGFSVPLGDWLRVELRPLVEETLFSTDLFPAGVFDATGLRRYWQQHLSGQKDHKWSLWTILSLQWWSRGKVVGG